MTSSTGVAANVRARALRVSRWNAVLWGGGMAWVLVIIAFSFVQLRSAREATKDEQKRLAALQRKSEELEARHAELEAANADLLHDLSIRQAEIEIADKNRKNLLKTIQNLDSASRPVAIEHLPLASVVTPRASAERDDSCGDGLMRFSCWLEIPPSRLRQVQSVTYGFAHSSFEQKEFQAINPDDGFRIQYCGWGALRRVLVTLHLRGGRTDEFSFDMVKLVNEE